MCDYRAMLVKYMDLVGEAEGVYFTSRNDWTPEEWAEMSKMLEEAGFVLRESDK